MKTFFEQFGLVRKQLSDKRVRGACLVVHWMGTRVALTAVNFAADNPSVGRSVVMPWDDETLPFAEPVALGAAVRDRLELADMSAAPAIVSLPRQVTTVRVIDISGIDEADIPGAVALQVETLEHSLNLKLTYDFIVHAGRTPESRFATLVTCPKSVTDGITSALSVAGIETHICCLGELSLGYLDRQNAGEPSMVVLANDVKLDAVLIRDEVPVAAVATKTPKDPAQAADLVDNLSDRLLASLPPELGISSLSRAVIFGTQAPSLVARLQRHPKIRVTAGHRPPDHDVLAHAVSHVRPAAYCLPDLLHPKLPPDPRQEYRIRLMRQTVCGVAALLLISIGLFSWHQSLAGNLQRITAHLEISQKILAQAEPGVRQWEFLTQWKAEQIDLPRELIRLANHIPNQERIYLTRLLLEDAPGDAAAVLRLDGVAKDNNDAMSLNRTLIGDGYELTPHGIEPSTRDSKFKSQFQIESALPHHHDE